MIKIKFTLKGQAYEAEAETHAEAVSFLKEVSTAQHGYNVSQGIQKARSKSKEARAGRQWTKSEVMAIAQHPTLKPRMLVRLPELQGRGTSAVGQMAGYIKHSASRVHASDHIKAMLAELNLAENPA